MGQDYTEKGSGPDLSGIMNSLLSNPAALSMLTSLLGNGFASPGGKSPPPPPPHHDCDCGCGCNSDCDGNSNGEDDCPKAPPLLPPTRRKKHGPVQDNRLCLLNALRPYLSAERCDMIDSLLRIMELMELLRKQRR